MDQVGFEIDAGDIGQLGWNEIDAALQHPSFSKLRKVEVRVIHWQDTYAWRWNHLSWDMESMPQCRARGVLHQSLITMIF